MSEQADQFAAQESVDLDLTAQDAQLREAVGEPTAVKIDGVVIHILHVAEWSSTAMSASANGDWLRWADEVILEDKELEAFKDADLSNYQLEAVFEACAKKGNLSAGKSRRSDRSSRRSRRQ